MKDLSIYRLKDDLSIIIKGADKGSVVVVWDREDYLKEAYRQLDDKEVYEQFSDDSSALANILMKALEKIRLRVDLPKDTLDYFLVKDSKIHKRLHDVSGRPVISNCGYYTENVSSFLDYHLQPLAHKVKSYIKDTNNFLNRLSSLGKLPQGAILCTVDAVGLYPNIPHSEGLTSLRRVLELRDNKQISSDTLVELAEIVLKNNTFQFDEKTWNRNWNKVCASICYFVYG